LETASRIENQHTRLEKTMTSSAGPEQTADLSKERLLFVLPSDIANSLQYLDDVDLHRLKSAVEAEIARRKPGASTGKADEVFVPTAARPVSSPREAAKIAEIPEGKANLVRASFEAGVKPPTIVRTFGISISVVNRIIRSMKKGSEP
jgi:hypothetical protein